MQLVTLATTVTLAAAQYGYGHGGGVHSGVRAAPYAAAHPRAHAAPAAYAAHPGVYGYGGVGIGAAHGLGLGGVYGGGVGFPTFTAGGPQAVSTGSGAGPYGQRTRDGDGLVYSSRLTGVRTAEEEEEKRLAREEVAVLEAIAAELAAEAEEEVVVVVSPSDGKCPADSLLSQSSRACCPATCGQCGGPGCAELVGGGSDCCTQIILEEADLCSESEQAPCRTGIAAAAAYPPYFPQAAVRSASPYQPRNHAAVYSSAPAPAVRSAYSGYGGVYRG